MKDLIKVLPVILIALTSCGGGSGENQDENASTEGKEMTGITADLSEHGMDYTIVLPDKKSVQTEIAANNFGGIYIKQGEGFALDIAYGEGDLDMLKFDLGEDLLYKSTILEESENHLLYKREIESSGMAPEFHIFYILKLKDDAVEVKNSKDITFTEEAARQMLQSAMTLKAKSAS